jgi:hypothetical protein
MSRRLTREELTALQAEVIRGAGDWTVESIAVDGVLIEDYVPADEMAEPSPHDLHGTSSREPPAGG